jgi:hypothetical protein
MRFTVRATVGRRAVTGGVCLCRLAAKSFLKEREGLGGERDQRGYHLKEEQEIHFKDPRVHPSYILGAVRDGTMTRVRMADGIDVAGVTGSLQGEAICKAIVKDTPRAAETFILRTAAMKPCAQTGMPS